MEDYRRKRLEPRRSIMKSEEIYEVRSMEELGLTNTNLGMRGGEARSR